jgi:hypothetical protein
MKSIMKIMKELKAFFSLCSPCHFCDVYSPHGPCCVSEVASTDCDLDAQRRESLVRSDVRIRQQHVKRNFASRIAVYESKYETIV